MSLFLFLSRIIWCDNQASRLCSRKHLGHSFSFPIMIVMSSPLFFFGPILYKDTENEKKKKEKTNRSLNGNVWLFIIGRWESFRWSYLLLLLLCLSSVFIIKRSSSIMTDEIKTTLSIQLILLTYRNLIFAFFFHNWLITSSISSRHEYWISPLIIHFTKWL
jgi:hypothetical protein